MRHISFALILTLVVVGFAFAHIGTTRFAPAVPDPTTMLIDGFQDDWDWYDLEFAITPDDWISSLGEFEGAGPNPAPDDFSASYFLAWSPVPDNALYCFARVIDDTLRAAEADNMRNWWNDDILVIGVDADHSGGNITCNSEPQECLNGFRYVLHAIFSNTQGTAPGGLAQTADYPNGKAPGRPPYGRIKTTVVPADATHMSTEVEITFETRLNLWVSYDINVGVESDQSIPYVFEEEKVLHVQVNYEDGDREANGEQDLWCADGSVWNGTVDGDKSTDIVPLMTIDYDPDTYGVYDEGATAVEHTTWARIKGAINR